MNVGGDALVKEILAEGVAIIIFYANHILVPHGSGRPLRSDYERVRDESIVDGGYVAPLAVYLRQVAETHTQQGSLKLVDATVIAAVYVVVTAV